MEKISVVVVSWNVAKSLRRCLKSILATRYPNLQTIVIDNASSDGTLKTLENLLELTVVKNDKNLGFPAAVNQGLKSSTGEFILVLNPDTRIPSNFFTKAVQFIKQHPDAGVMGPKFTDPDGTPQGSVFPEPSIIAHIHEFWLGQKGLTLKECPQVGEPTVVNSISGGCIFMPRSTYARLGPLTEEVFMYYEDLDYCRRVRRAGLKVYFHPGITIVHEHGSSTKQSPQAQEYLWQASLWYNGPLKHYLMWFISWSGQKLTTLGRIFR